MNYLVYTIENRPHILLTTRSIYIRIEHDIHQTSLFVPPIDFHFGYQ